MRILHYIIAAVVPALLLSSCIKDEPLNAECDIIAVSLPGDVLNRPPQISNDAVLLIVKNNVSLLNLAPEFELTPGATIEPPSGTPRNFVFPQEYTVTSQDGSWHKTYKVTAQRNNVISLSYDFEDVNVISALQGRAHYDQFYQPGTNNVLTWASANSAFALTLQGTTPNTFPTYQGDNGVKGKCCVLVTRNTGTFGAAAGKPIAAGSIFMGTFDGTNAMSKPLQATHFGIPFSNIPASLSGYYKYTPGETFREFNSEGKFEPAPGKTDIFNIYAVLYEVTADTQWLDGSNVLSPDNPNIICTAVIGDRHASEEWVPFNIPFVYREGKSIDMEKLKAGHYNITVVASSSEGGDYFAGAYGSTLQIDEFTLNCSTEQQ